MNTTEPDQDSAHLIQALMAWMDSQDVEPAIAVSALIGTLSLTLGSEARTPRHLLTVLQTVHTQLIEGSFDAFCLSHVPPDIEAKAQQP